MFLLCFQFFHHFHFSFSQTTYYRLQERLKNWQIMRCKYRVFLFCLFFVFTFNNLNHHIQQLVCVYVCVLFSPVYHFFLFPSAGGFTLYNSPSVFSFSFSSTKISTEKSFKFTQKNCHSSTR